MQCCTDIGNVLLAAYIGSIKDDAGMQCSLLKYLWGERQVPYDYIHEIYSPALLLLLCMVITKLQ